MADSVGRHICPGLVHDSHFEGNCKLTIAGSLWLTFVDPRVGLTSRLSTKSQHIFHQHRWAHSFKTIHTAIFSRRKEILPGATTDHQGNGSVESFWARNPLLLGTLTVTQPSWSSFHSEEKGTKYRQWSRMDTCNYGEEQDGQLYEHHSQSMTYLRYV